jgi:ankyrin repeat protein
LPLRTFLTQNGRAVDIQLRRTAIMLECVEVPEHLIILIENQETVNAADAEGKTPLHLAAHKGHRGVAELLRRRKARINAKDAAGSTPLQAAEAQGHEDVAELLRERGSTR